MEDGYVVQALALEFVMAFIDDPRDRHAISLVCHQWYAIDATTRKHVTVRMCYSTVADRLSQRFPHLESLKVKGKPRAAMYGRIREDWGGYARPWIKEIAAAGFMCLKSLHFRRMIVTDEDLEILAKSHGHMLHTLKLDWCSGFSTHGLLHVACKIICLKTLLLNDSSIKEHDDQWLHVLAKKNTTLENLEFDMTNISQISIHDLELIAQKCRSLVSVKINKNCEIWKLNNFFRAATVLEEFGGAFFIGQPDVVAFPPRLCSLDLIGMTNYEMPMVFPFANLLKKLNLFDTLLNTEDHCQLLQLCPNLEVLKAKDVIGDMGLEVLAQHCKKLRRIRIEKGNQVVVQGVVSQRGLSALAQGCVDLEHIVVHVSTITNNCLETIGSLCKNLRDFRLVWHSKEKENPPEFPLDNGVRALLMGCQKIRRFGFSLRPGGLTDVGFRHVGVYGNNVRWMLLGFLGECETGLLELSKGCPNLQKLEMRACRITGQALALSVVQLTSLRYLWFQEDLVSITKSELSPMDRPYWNIEHIHADNIPSQILAYYSLVGQRTDYPAATVSLLN